MLKHCTDVHIHTYVCIYVCSCTYILVHYVFGQNALESDPNTWIQSAGPFPGLLDERDYWTSRLSTLVSIREQLSSLLSLTILSHLEEAHSSYSGAFGQVYKDVDKVNDVV